MNGIFLDDCVSILSRTPAVVNTMLRGLREPWTTANEGPETWSAYDVVGHLIHGEQTDWMVRIKTILHHGESKPFTPFDRLAQFNESKGKTLDRLLDDFSHIRKANLATFADFKITEQQLSLTGTHPKFGRVTLHQLIATWVAHDLDHLNQINRVMATRYKGTVGPWIEFLSILRERDRSPAK